MRKTTDDGAIARDRLAAWARRAADRIPHGLTPVRGTVAELLRLGTLGLGAFAGGSDGDGDGLVVLDRRCLRMRPDGTATEAAAADEVAFAVVSTFSPDLVITVASVASRADLEARIAAVLPPCDFDVAVRADGVFDRVQTRSGGTGSATLRAVAGSLVGFRTPGAGGAGTEHHLGFLGAAGSRGGAFVELGGFSGRIELGFSTAVHPVVPERGSPVGEEAV
ncbi:acetolactate decarboxylase [Curtobacterium sp. VKM Ac-1376]|uniref:acetolactate decarboxylase n=1 Tax=Curtobacterium sp. VKM Ac-1376 TaxID=123312 RepID=UPI00188CCB75|nr:acetolactate decarboxylase [Curtobacterium sp. VKM Ac-1376]MBF4613430.1 acetolactate decarboxylase [Curtobacterium sp. VKM Ac-1376]